MDFISKFLHQRLTKSGGGSNSASGLGLPAAPSQENIKKHNLISKQLKDTPVVSEKAVVPANSEELQPSSKTNGLQTVDSVVSLPDLLPPEAAAFRDRKHTDTDTDTTEYESAAETDPLDSNTPVGNEIFNTFQEAVGEKVAQGVESSSSSPVPLQENTDICPSQNTDVNKSDLSNLGVSSKQNSSLIEEPVEYSVEQSFVSELCEAVQKLSLDTSLIQAGLNSVSGVQEIADTDSPISQSNLCETLNLSLDTSTRTDGTAVPSQDLFLKLECPSVFKPYDTKEESELHLESVAKEGTSLFDPCSQVTCLLHLTCQKEEKESEVSHVVSNAPVNVLDTNFKVRQKESPQQPVICEESQTNQPFQVNFPPEEKTQNLHVTHLSLPPEVPSPNHDTKFTGQNDESESLQQKNETEPLNENISYKGTVTVNSVVSSLDLKSNEREAVQILDHLAAAEEIAPSIVVQNRNKCDQKSPVKSLFEVHSNSTLESKSASKLNDSDVIEIEVGEHIEFSTRQESITDDGTVTEDTLQCVASHSELDRGVDYTVGNENKENLCVKTYVNGEAKSIIQSISIDGKSIPPVDLGANDVSELSSSENKPKTCENLNVDANFDPILEHSDSSWQLISQSSDIQVGLALKGIDTSTLEGSPKTESKLQVTEKEETEPILSKRSSDEPSQLDIDELHKTSNVIESIADVATKFEGGRLQDLTFCLVDAVPRDHFQGIDNTIFGVFSHTESCTECNVDTLEVNVKSETLGTSPQDLVCGTVQSPFQSEEISALNYSIPLCIEKPAQESLNAIRPPSPVAGLNEKDAELRDAIVLNELLEICDRQQKDLDQVEQFDGDYVANEAIVGDKEIDNSVPSHTVPSILSQTFESKHSRYDICEPSVVNSVIDPCDDFTDSGNLSFDDIAIEANKLAESFLDSKDEIDVENDSDSPCGTSINNMAESTELSHIDDAGNPFVTQSPVHQILPLTEKKAIRTSKSRSNSPLKSSCPGAVSTGIASSGSPSEILAEHPEPFKSSMKMHGSPSRDTTLVNYEIVSCSPKDGSGKRGTPTKVKSSETAPMNPALNQSEAGPDIADETPCQTEDVFKDAAAFDFLSSIGGTQTAHDLRKTSLYAKFDPLVEPVLPSEKNVPLSPHPEASELNSTGDGLPEESLTTSKDYLKVQSESLELTDKLITFTPTPKKPMKKYQEHSDKTALQSPTKEKQEVVSISHEDNRSRQSTTESDSELAAVQKEMHILQEVIEKERQQHRKEIVTLRAALSHFEESNQKKSQKMNEKSQELQQLSLILEEYEKTISRLVTEKEQEKQAHEKELMKLTKEKETVQVHLNNIEIAFSDVHQKYEKTKEVIQGMKKNEEVLRDSLAGYDSILKKQEEKYEALKAHAMSQLESANQELDSLRRNQELEISKLKAMLKKAEIKVTSLQESLEQKTKENGELLAICDDLIGKVGTNN